MIQVEVHVGEKQLDISNTSKQQEDSVWTDFVCRDQCLSHSGARTGDPVKWTQAGECQICA